MSQCRGHGRDGRGCDRSGRGYSILACVDRGKGTSGSICDRLPKTLSTFLNGWEEVTKKLPYQIISLEEYSDLNHGDVIMVSYFAMVTRVVNIMQQKGIEVNKTNILATYFLIRRS